MCNVTYTEIMNYTILFVSKPCTTHFNIYIDQSNIVLSVKTNTSI